MMKWLAKKLIPSPKSLAEMAAKEFQKCVNGSSKAEAIATYTQKIESIATYANSAIALLKDGQIDDKERGEIAKMIEPLFEAVVAAI